MGYVWVGVCVLSEGKGWAGGLLLGWYLCVVWCRVTIFGLFIWGTVKNAPMFMRGSSYILFVIVA